MVPDFYYTDYSRPFRFWTKECTGSTQLMTKMKSFQNDFLLYVTDYSSNTIYEQNIHTDYLMRI